MFSKVFVSPHSDDECLFGSFTIQRERPLVMVVYDSFIQVTRGDPDCYWELRRIETLNGVHYMDPEVAVVFCGLRDDTVYTTTQVTDAILHALPTSNWETISHIWAPAYEEGGHDQHNLVSQACHGLANHRYLTYTRGKGKSRTYMHEGYCIPAKRVDPTPDMIARKLRALSCYTSQIANPSTQSWFTRDIEEYYAT